MQPSKLGKSLEQKIEVDIKTLPIDPDFQNPQTSNNTYVIPMQQQPKPTEIPVPETQNHNYPSFVDQQVQPLPTNVNNHNQQMMQPHQSLPILQNYMQAPTQPLQQTIPIQQQNQSVLASQNQSQLQPELSKLNNTSSLLPQSQMQDPLKPKQESISAVVQEGQIPSQQESNIYPKQANNQTYSTTIQCPKCSQVGKTKVKYRPGQQTFLYCILFGLIFLPCLLVPFCLVDTYNNKHYCKNCKQEVGEKQAKCC